MQLQVGSCLAMELPQCVKPSLGQLLVQLFLNTYGRLRGLGRSQHWDVDNRFNCPLLRRPERRLEQALHKSGRA